MTGPWRPNSAYQSVRLVPAIFLIFFLGEMTNAACCYQLVDCDEKISVIDPITLKKEKLPGNGILNAQDANA